MTSSDAYSEATGPYRPVTSVVCGLTAGTAVLFADVVAAKSAFDVVFNISQMWSWLMALALTLAAFLGAYEVGLLGRKVVAPAARWRQRLARAGVLALSVVSWAALGAAMFWLRLVQGRYTGDPQATMANELPVATLVALLYLLGGFTIASRAYALANPKLTAYARAQRTVTRLTRRLSASRAELTSLTLVLERWDQDVLSRLDAVLAARLDQIDAGQALILDGFRAALATEIGDPGATSHIVRSAQATAADRA
jgi:hypothetical protein